MLMFIILKETILLLVEQKLTLLLTLSAFSRSGIMEYSNTSTQ